MSNACGTESIKKIPESDWYIFQRWQGEGQSGGRPTTDKPSISLDELLSAKRKIAEVLKRESTEDNLALLQEAGGTAQLEVLANGYDVSKLGVVPLLLAIADDLSSRSDGYLKSPSALVEFCRVAERLAGRLTHHPKLWGIIEENALAVAQRGELAPLVMILRAHHKLLGSFAQTDTIPYALMEVGFARKALQATGGGDMFSFRGADSSGPAAQVQGRLVDYWLERDFRDKCQPASIDRLANCFLRLECGTGYMTVPDLLPIDALKDCSQHLLGALIIWCADCRLCLDGHFTSQLVNSLTISLKHAPNELSNKELEQVLLGLISLRIKKNWLPRAEAAGAFGEVLERRLSTCYSNDRTSLPRLLRNTFLTLAALNHRYARSEIFPMLGSLVLHTNEPPCSFLATLSASAQVDLLRNFERMRFYQCLVYKELGAYTRGFLDKTRNGLQDGEIAGVLLATLSLFSSMRHPDDLLFSETRRWLSSAENSRTFSPARWCRFSRHVSRFAGPLEERQALYQLAASELSKNPVDFDYDRPETLSLLCDLRHAAIILGQAEPKGWEAHIADAVERSLKTLPHVAAIEYGLTNPRSLIEKRVEAALLHLGGTSKDISEIKLSANVQAMRPDFSFTWGGRLIILEVGIAENHLVQGYDGISYLNGVGMATAILAQRCTTPGHYLFVTKASFPRYSSVEADAQILFEIVGHFVAGIETTPTHAAIKDRGRMILEKLPEWAAPGG